MPPPSHSGTAMETSAITMFTAITMITMITTIRGLRMSTRNGRHPLQTAGWRGVSDRKREGCR